MRKMVLVESGRKEATRAVLERVEAAELRRSSGKKEWVEVYDWRLLGALAKIEADQDHRAQDETEVDPFLLRGIFRKHWVGLV